MTDNPLLLSVQHAIEEAEQSRIMERALLESAPAEKIVLDDRRYTDRVRMRNIPVTALGVAAVQPGMQPLQALLAKERRKSAQRRG